MLGEPHSTTVLLWQSYQYTCKPEKNMARTVLTVFAVFATHHLTGPLCVGSHTHACIQDSQASKQQLLRWGSQSHDSLTTGNDNGPPLLVTFTHVHWIGWSDSLYTCHSAAGTVNYQWATLLLTSTRRLMNWSLRKVELL
jgi:hypothetical protein